MEIYKYLNNTRIILKVNEIKIDYPKNEQLRQIQKKLGVNKLQANYLINTEDSNVKKKLFELANIKDEYKYITYFEAGYTYYEYFSFVKFMGLFDLPLFILLIVTSFGDLKILGLSKLNRILVILLLMALVLATGFFIDYMLKKRYLKTSKQLDNDEIVLLSGSVLNVKVISPLEHGNVCYIKIIIKNNENNKKSKIIVTLCTPFEAQNPEQVNDFITKELFGKNVRFRKYKKTNFSVDSSIDFEKLFHKANNIEFKKFDLHNEEVTQTKLFLNYNDISSLNNTSFIEIQYCSATESNPIDINNVIPYNKHSLYLDINKYQEFFASYSNIIDDIDSKGVRYYSNEKVNDVIQKLIEDKPNGYVDLVNFLSSKERTNGIYVLGL